VIDWLGLRICQLCAQRGDFVLQSRDSLLELGDAWPVDSA
jgi:hypothetical protein